MFECFAYWKDTPSGGLRWGTLIVANGDERIVGNAVLKNPGSASPVESLFVRDDGRLEFTPDATMFALADLFRLESGTIRIFNLLDIRAVEPADAVRQLDAGVQESSRDHVAQALVLGPHVPTYLGWGDLWKHPKLRAKARRIFDIILLDTPCLNPDMEMNPFFHPLYLMRYGRNMESCWKVIQAFQECL